MNMNNMNKEMNNIVPAMTNMFRREREGGGTSTEVRSLSSLLRFLLLQFLEVCSIQFVLTYMV